MSDSLDGARERRAGLRAALGEVERSLASPSTGRSDAWLKTLSADLERLSESLDLHIRTSEAPGGLLADIVESAPRLANKVDAARKEHAQLRYRLDKSMKAVAEQRGDDVRAVREQIVEVLAGIVRHRHLGADLVYEAFSVDIEAAD